MSGWTNVDAIAAQQCLRWENAVYSKLLPHRRHVNTIDRLVQPSGFGFELSCESNARLARRAIDKSFKLFAEQGLGHFQ